MRKRFCVSIAGGIIGLAASVPLTDTLGLSQTLALVVCSVAGLAIGFVGSKLFDVFSRHTSDGDVTSG